MSLCPVAIRSRGQHVTVMSYAFSGLSVPISLISDRTRRRHYHLRRHNQYQFHQYNKKVQEKMNKSNK